MLNIFLFTVYLTAAWLAIPCAAIGGVGKVGVYEYRLFVYTSEKGNIDGLYLRFLKDVAEKEKWDLEFVHGSWQECLSRLENGRIDLLVAIAFSVEREKKVQFSRQAFLTNWGQLYTRRGVNISSLPDLSGKRIAVYRKGIFSDYLQRVLHNIGIEFRFLEVPDYDSVIGLLLKGEAEAGVLNHVYAIQLGRSEAIRKTDIIFMPTELRFAAPKTKDPRLLDAIDEHLAKAKADKDSKYYKTLNEWSISRIESISGDSICRPGSNTHWLRLLV